MKPHFDNVVTLIMVCNYTNQPIVNFSMPAIKATHSRANSAYSRDTLSACQLTSMTEKSKRLHAAATVTPVLYTGEQDLAKCTVMFDSPTEFLDLIKHTNSNNWDTSEMLNLVNKYYGTASDDKERTYENVLAFAINSPDGSNRRKCVISVDISDCEDSRRDIITKYSVVGKVFFIHAVPPVLEECPRYHVYSVKELDALLEGYDSLYELAGDTDRIMFSFHTERFPAIDYREIPTQ